MLRSLAFFLFLIFLASCAPQPRVPAANVQLPKAVSSHADTPPGFALVDGSRPLTFPADFGAHEGFRSEWWYYTGNLQTPEGRHFGFELTIFRVGLLPPTVNLPADSNWYSHSTYFAHFALSDIASDRFHAFERYSRPGPGLAGAQAVPYRVWLEDWSITERSPGVYLLQAAQDEIALDLTLKDKRGVILQGEKGYLPNGEKAGNAAYYYSQPRLQADGVVQIEGRNYSVSGLAWKDHEFGSGGLEANQVGWDWFALQFQDGSALMLFQLRQRDGEISAFSSGTFIPREGAPHPIQKADFEIAVQDQWRSPHTGGGYPAAWDLRLAEPDCLLHVQPWMADQELHFPTVTYWEGAVQFEGSCRGTPAQGTGYVELTGYVGNLPLP